MTASTTGKMCFDKVLPTNLMKVQQIQRTRGGRSRAVSLIGQQWPNGSTISIRFMNGTEQQKDMVREHAPELTEYANRHFEFTDDPTFDPSDGALSYVGTDYLNILLHAATLNLG